MAFFMNRIRLEDGNTVFNNICLLFFACLPYLYVVGKFSKSLAFDSMLFYILWLVGFWTVMFLSPAGDKLNGLQILGLAISIGGLIIFKVCA